MGVLLRLRLFLLAAEGSLLWSVDAQVTHHIQWGSEALTLEVSLSDALDFAGDEFHTMYLVEEVSRAAPGVVSARTDHRASQTSPLPRRKTGNRVSFALVVQISVRDAIET